MISQAGNPVDYHLPFVSSSDTLDSTQVHLNPYLGKTLRLKYHRKIACTHCGRITRKSFNQGYCYPCFKKLARCDLCIMRPELCHFAQGTCREPTWGEAFCMQEHIVYLANSSATKVGITRQSQIPTRWIDQGATQALPVFRVQSRFISGLVEVAFKRYVADKTHWQRMLKSEPAPVDLMSIRDTLVVRVQTALDEIKASYGDLAIRPITDQEVVSINYPVLEYPTKVVALNFDKTPLIEGTLMGIKGQYLIFDIGVINLRKFTAYDVELI